MAPGAGTPSDVPSGPAVNAVCQIAKSKLVRPQDQVRSVTRHPPFGLWVSDKPGKAVSYFQTCQSGTQFFLPAFMIELHHGDARL